VNSFEREIAPGLTLIVDESTCLVLVSDRPRHTVTNVRRFQQILDEAIVAAYVARDQAEEERKQRAAYYADDDPAYAAWWGKL
jgi:hypothetical protein